MTRKEALQLFIYGIIMMIAMTITVLWMTRREGWYAGHHDYNNVIKDSVNYP